MDYENALNVLDNIIDNFSKVINFLEQNPEYSNTEILNRIDEINALSVKI